MKDYGAHCEDCEKRPVVFGCDDPECANSLAYLSRRSRQKDAEHTANKDAPQ